MKILNLINPERTEIAFESRPFPDGQPHFKLPAPSVIGGEWEHVQILTRIRSGNDIALLGLAVDSLRSVVKGRISVNIAYMLGARMDRAIGPGQPFTLRVLAGMLNAACEQANDVRILDPHSPKTLDLVQRSTAIMPDALVKQALNAHAERPVVVIPDQGAIGRAYHILDRIGGDYDIAKCAKKRDPHTGALSGFELVEVIPPSRPLRGRDCLIIDDLCDGGGTFAGIAEVLRAQGARSVDLCVTHGVFSKDLPIAGIDHVFTTDSYSDYWVEMNQDGVTVMKDYLLNWVTWPK